MFDTLRAVRGLRAALLGVVAIAAACGAGVLREPDAARIPGTPFLAAGRIEVVLELPPGSVDGVVDGLHDVQVRIVNRSADAIRLVLPGDGSDFGWRTPFIGWSVLPSDSDQRHPPVPAPRTGRGCGNINPIRAAEIVELDPGGSVLADGYFGRPMIGKGARRVAFFYRNDPSLHVRGIPLGPHEPGTLERMHQSTRCEAWSEELVVTRR